MMDLRPIEARADEFFTWAGRFDSGKRVDAAFASAADVPALIDEVRRLHAALRAVLAVLDYHEQANPQGREQWNADIRAEIAARINNTTKEDSNV